MPLIVVTTSPRVPPGLLTPAAWKALSDGRVLTGCADHPYLPYLAEAGTKVEVIALASDSAADSAADSAVVSAPADIARRSRTEKLVWLAAQDGDEAFMRAVGHAALALDDPPVIEVVPGSYDLPGARLLDLVQVMDRLRSECPWDRGQTHESLVPYLVEEAYEVLDTIDQGDYGALQEELGDLLLQIVFHARIAQERTGTERSVQDGDGFDIDDVATGIVDKLIRRHPHVFADVRVSGAAEVSDNWEAIKAAERAAKGETESALSGVPMAQPALSLAAQLLRRAGRAGAPDELADELGDELGDEHGDGLPTNTGARLFQLVRQAQAAGVDPEAELRAAAREYRRRVEEWERERSPQ
ncbi:nucleoside triphosphate pyrophosphohydrolase [Sphaerimonospora thailandensis]|uniref:Nucleoside triphosphate pyrophosphohydrolase n=1 Tax=Sphaerimonospora thailandensis TaxID=795644 RepID=A0A8J3R9J1_9ACTN|nr:MazG family protein [Sphaerimonospora thailandensis]GIH71891.1 nucleoside triphosphate pyrophosphohydrolase [Sphaerimonospora thailandensis]